MYRLIIVGSPNARGRSASLAYELFESCIDECPDDQVKMVSVASLSIEGCTGCDGCRGLIKKAQERGGLTENGKQSASVETSTDSGVNVDIDNANQDTLTPARPKMCVIDDDMQEVYNAVCAADEIIIVAPVYFAGPTSQFKALLDRLQPFFWTDARHQNLKPATLHVIGEGHDPFGYDALVLCVQSALLVAGFELHDLFDWVGCFNADGEIIKDAQQYALYIDEESGDAEDNAEDVVQEAEQSNCQAEEIKLNLSSGKSSNAKASNAKSAQGKNGAYTGSRNAGKSDGRNVNGNTPKGGAAKGNGRRTKGNR